MIEGNGTDPAYNRIALDEAFFEPPRPMPGPIADAIAAVQLGIKRIAKADENQHGGYAFTSVDDIYELVGPLLAQAKLVVTPYELRRPIITMVDGAKGPKQIAEICVGFMLNVGENCYADKHLCETLVIQVTGTQTFHAAKSYACKTFYRGLWKIPTGEPDHVDLAKQVGDDEKRVEQIKKKPKLEKLAHPASSKKKDEIIVALGAYTRPLSPEDQENFLENWGSVIDLLQPAHTAEVQTAYRTARAK